MKYLSCFSLLLLFIIIGCGKSPKNDAVFNTEPVSVKEVNLPDGADPDVPAEAGGKGFSGAGWNTNESYLHQGDNKSIKGGKVSMAIDYFPVTFAPVGKDCNTIINSVIRNLLYEPLLKKDIYTDEYIPSLASHWQILSDSMTYRFRIDPDSRWADGRRVTSDDIIMTYKLYTDSTLFDPYSNELWNSYDPPKKESMYIFSIRSHKKDWRQFIYISEYFTVLPSYYLKDLNGKNFSEKFQFNPIIGSGPYIILQKDIDKGSSFSIRRRSDYWAANKNFSKGLNNFDEIKLYFIQDANLAIEKFKKNELDVFYIKSAQQFNEGFNFEKVKTNEIVKQKIFTQKSPVFQGICLNTRKNIFKDIRIRKALTYLFDKKKFIEKLFYNEYLPEYSRYQGTEYGNKSVPQMGFNPDSAVALLKQAGLDPSGKNTIMEFEILCLQGQQRVMELYKEDLSKYGIKVHLRLADIAYISKISNDKNFEALTISLALPVVPSPESNFLSRYINETGGQNWEGISNTMLDSLCSIFPMQFEKASRIKIMQQIDSISCNYVGFIPLWYSPYERIAYHNKFSYPEFSLPRKGTYYDLLQYWYYDKNKIKEYEENKCREVPLVIEYWKDK